MTLLEFQELMKKENLSEEEKKILEPYRVKRAVILAAGLGIRLRPLTNDKPKPLITVNGVRIIDTIIEALNKNGIDEIYIIRGYKAEAFDDLINKYPNIHMLNNVVYDQGNNILSMGVAGNLLAGAYVMPADLYIVNPSVFSTYQYCSNVLGYKVSESDDWCIETDEKRVIKRLSPGGTNCHKDAGVFYWNEKDGLQLSKDIAAACKNKENWQRFWCTVPFDICKDNYASVLRECEEGDIIEIDTVEELIALDSAYHKVISDD